jgi:hypothetical protein
MRVRAENAVLGRMDTRRPALVRVADYQQLRDFRPQMVDVTEFSDELFYVFVATPKQ